MPEIARAFKISLNDLEWVAAFHAKKDKPHCHLVVWNKNQDISIRRKPFINYKQIKSAVAKGVFKEELKAMYEIKDVSKSEIGKMSKEEIDTYKESLKEMYQNEEIYLNAIDTEKAQNFVNERLEDMEENEIIYIVNNSDPNNYTQIKKLDDKKYEFKNIGERAILYKDNTYLEAVTFLSKFSNLRVIKSESELNQFIQNRKEEFNNIEDELKEIMPSIFNTPIISSNIKQENIEQIINKMKEFEIDKSQYNSLIEEIKNKIKYSIEFLYNNYEKNNKNLETDRTYKKIIDNLISMEEFEEIYSYKFYEDIRYKEGSISHCGYPDYMWQSGAERNIYC